MAATATTTSLNRNYSMGMGITFPHYSSSRTIIQKKNPWTYYKWNIIATPLTIPNKKCNNYSSSCSSSALSGVRLKLPPPPSLPTTHLKGAEVDAISLLNDRILREHCKRDSRPTHLMDAQEADKYIQLVKEQQQRGLQKLKAKGGGAAVGDALFGFKVDPYTLRPGDYVVHKKVGIGRFVAIKFDMPKHYISHHHAVEYVFIEYADGMAKLSVKQASRMLYRYNLPNETKKPRTLSKLSDPSAWERRRVKGKVAVQKMVVDLMELYIHRLKQTRPPYPKTPAIAEFASQFPYEPTPDQKQV